MASPGGLALEAVQRLQRLTVVATLAQVVGWTQDLLGLVSKPSPFPVASNRAGGLAPRLPTVWVVRALPDAGHESGARCELGDLRRVMLMRVERVRERPVRGEFVGMSHAPPPALLLALL